MKRPNRALGRLIFEIDRSHKIRHTNNTHTPSRTSLNEWSSCLRDRYLHNTKQTQQTNNQAVSGIRSLDLRHQATAYLRLRQHDHCERIKRQIPNSKYLLAVDVRTVALNLTFNADVVTTTRYMYCSVFVCSFIHSFSSLFLDSPLQNDFSTECDLVLPVSVSCIL